MLCSGGIVSRGYLDDPVRTAETFDADGWLHTGDIGEWDADGNLRIVDRKKELIITAGGKNISPANLEARLKASPLIGQAAVVGDSRPYLVALLVLDPEVTPAWAAARGVEGRTLAELAAEPLVLAEVERVVTEANGHVSQVESIRRWVVLGEEWAPDSAAAHRDHEAEAARRPGRVRGPDRRALRRGRARVSERLRGALTRTARRACARPGRGGGGRGRARGRTGRRRPSCSATPPGPGSEALAAKAPGRSVEVRVPPWGAVQCVAGTRHTRGTPGAVVETDPVTWVRLAAGTVAFADAVADGRVRAGGERSDLSALLPL